MVTSVKEPIVHDPSDFGLTVCGIDRTKGVHIPVSSKSFNCPDCIEHDKKHNPSKYIQRKVERYVAFTLTDINKFIIEMKIKRTDILSMCSIRPTPEFRDMKYEICFWVPNNKKARAYRGGDA